MGDHHTEIYRFQILTYPCSAPEDQVLSVTPFPCLTILIKTGLLLQGYQISQTLTMVASSR